MSHEVESMFSVKLQPWHGLGRVLHEYPDSATALRESGLDWPVTKRQVFFQTDGGNFSMAEDKSAVVRLLPRKDETGYDEDMLSVVSNQYQILQNRDAFSIFDPMVKSGDLVYETAGSLSNGKRVWILARYAKETMMIQGSDEVRPYLLFLNGHDGITAVTVQPTPIRVVCNNTLQASLGCGQSITFDHKGDIALNVTKAIETIEQMREKFLEMKRVFNDMAETHIDREEANDIILAVLYPHDVIPAECEVQKADLTPRRQARMDAAMKRIWELVAQGQGASNNTRGTLWGVYNALTEFSEYWLGSRVKDMAAYQLFGNGAAFKVRALKECKDYMEAQGEEEKTAWMVNPAPF